MAISTRWASGGWTISMAALATALMALPAPIAVAQSGDGMRGAEPDTQKDGDDGAAAAGPIEVNPLDPKWLDRLPRLDRALMDALIGYAPPDFTDDLVWIGGDETSWEDLRGKVVLLQSWTSQKAGGRSIPARIDRVLERAQDKEGVSADDVVVLLLHTPEGADRAKLYLERQPVEQTVLIDPSGRFSDALGVYKRPVNVLVDRQGVVRGGGVELDSLPIALRTLVEEAFDAESPAPPARAAEKDEAAEGSAEFPEISGGVGSARDMRGRRGPEFYVEQWITRRPDPTGKVVVLDFWATWCKPCRRSIPHLNELAREFRNDVVIVGVTDESSSQYKQGLIRHNIDEDDIHYPLALDSDGRMKRTIGIRGIPHALVLSSDWIVRWQGHPATLNETVLRQIVKADQAMQGPQGGGADAQLEQARGRWARELKR